MSEQIETTPPVRAGEHAVQLDTGQWVAVRVARDIVGAAVHYHATARAIEADGSSTQDAAGRPVERELRHHSRDIAAVEAITADCERAVLGDAPEMVDWSPQYLEDASIQVALALAPFAG